MVLFKLASFLHSTQSKQEYLEQGKTNDFQNCLVKVATLNVYYHERIHVFLFPMKYELLWLSQPSSLNHLM